MLMVLVVVETEEGMMAAVMVLVVETEEGVMAVETEEGVMAAVMVLLAVETEEGVMAVAAAAAESAAVEKGAAVERAQVRTQVSWECRDRNLSSSRRQWGMQVMNLALCTRIHNCWNFFAHQLAKIGLCRY